MSVYLDTSIVVAAITSELRTPAVQGWLRRLATEAVISDWVVAETPSALSMKVRSGALTVAQRDIATAEFDSWCAGILRIVPVRRADFHTAGRYAARAELNLRAGDALHLALAATEQLAIATLDRRMAAAAVTLGFTLADFGETP